MAFHPSAHKSCAGDPGTRAKIRSDEAEPEGFGGSKVEGENEVWTDLRRNPGLPARILRAGMEAKELGYCVLGNAVSGSHDAQVNATNPGVANGSFLSLGWEQLGALTLRDLDRTHYFLRRRKARPYRSFLILGPLMYFKSQ
jgi:hypothetical protein